MHYYNYAFDYSDLCLTPEGGQRIAVDLTRPLSPEFWGRLEPTYRAVGGVLEARDSEPVQLVLAMLGAPGREVIRATAEGYGIRGQAPLEGHLIVRERPADPQAQSTFCAVLEPTNQEPRLRGVEAVEVKGDAAPGQVTAFVVTTATAAGPPRRDLIVSSRDDCTTPCRLSFAGRELTFTGRFALYTSVGDKLVAARVVGGARYPSLRGQVTAASLEKSAIAVKLSEGSAEPTEAFRGRKLLVRNPTYGYVSTYTIAGVERLGARLYRLALSMPPGSGTRDRRQDRPGGRGLRQPDAGHEAARERRSLRRQGVARRADRQGVAPEVGAGGRLRAGRPGGPRGVPRGRQLPRLRCRHRGRGGGRHLGRGEVGETNG